MPVAHRMKLAGDQVGRVNFAGLKFVQFALLPPELRRSRQLIAPLPDGSQLVEQLREALPRLVGVGKGVENRKLVDGLEQVLVIVLAVHVDEQLADRPHHAGRHGLAVG